MPVPDALGVYLNDHLAGAAAGVDLIRRISEELGGAADDLVADIETDRTFLADLIKALDIREQAVKQALSSALEKLGKLKMNRVVSGSEELAFLLEIEAMAMGIEGKRALWRTMEALAPTVPELADTDFAALRLRAEDQQLRLEVHHQAAAAAALAASSGAG